MRALLIKSMHSLWLMRVMIIWALLEYLHFAAQCPRDEVPSFRPATAAGHGGLWSSRAAGRRRRSGLLPAAASRRVGAVPPFQRASYYSAPSRGAWLLFQALSSPVCLAQFS